MARRSKQKVVMNHHTISAMNDADKQTYPLAYVKSLDHEGRGVAHVDGKVVFIEGALPYETVRYARMRDKTTFEEARAVQIVQDSFVRTKPACPHFGVCGGCVMQHIESSAQVAMKQKILEDNFQRISKTKPDLMLTPIAGPSFHYRFRARLSVKYVAKKNDVLVALFFCS